VSASESPAQKVSEWIAGYWVSQAIYVAASLGLADLLRDGPKGSAELAALTQTHAGSLHRLLRALAAVGLFEQIGEDRFALAASGEVLRSDAPDSVRSWALFLGEEWNWLP
jgi:hypothetical protein